MMRIITGRARGTQLYTLAGETTRPTSERAKEAVFSMLQFELSGARVLDLFAGSGQMALEAISRGASSAVLVDASREAVDILRKNVAKTHFEAECEIKCADYAQFLRGKCQASFNLVILDPPYAARLVAPALKLLLCGGWLSAGATIVCESAEEDIFENDLSLAAQFEVRRRAKYGVAHMTVLTYKEESAT